MCCWQQKGTTKPFPYVNARKSYDAAHPFKATLAQRRELQSAGSDRSTLHVEVDIAGSGMTYQTGDHLVGPHAHTRRLIGHRDTNLIPG